MEKLWIVVKGIKNSEYLLSEGDVIRLGKAKVKVIEMNGNKQILQRKKTLHSKYINQGGAGYLFKGKSIKNIPLEVSLKTEKINGINCRICLGDESDENNQMIAPCYCTGTMGIVHVACLQKWLASKIMHNISINSHTYSWKSLECELCKFKYSNTISINDKIIDLIVIKKPENNYIVLESFNDEQRILNVMSFEEKNTLKIGRGNDNDMRIPDISISRNHAMIKFKNSGFYLEDLNSKFGTLIKLKKALRLDLDNKIQIQCGRNLLKINATKPWSFCGCFSSCSKENNSAEDMENFVNEVLQKAK